MNFEGFGRKKDEEELAGQLRRSEEALGTDIVPPNSSEQDALSLDISDIQGKYKARYDAYLSALRAEHQGDVNTEEIARAKEWVTALNNLDSYIKEHESQDDPLLRERQFLVFKKIRDFLEAGKKKGYVKLPTGTGKTVLFAKVTESLGMKTMVVSPTIQILEQNAAEFEASTEAEHGMYYGKSKDLEKRVTNITYQSLVAAVKNGTIDPGDIPVLILDEAHRSLGEARSEAIAKFDGIQLEFTATPKFSKDRMLASEQIFSMDIRDAIEEGLACRTQTVHAFTDIDLSSVEIRGGKYDDAQLEKAVNVHGRNRAAVELYREKFSDLKAFCNCSGVAHAEALAKMFNENGVSAACVTGDTPDGEEENQKGWILKEYKNGSIRVLTNARALLEGFNEPTCAVTLNLHPTLSLVDAEQRARSGRLDPKDPDKWSYVVDFIDMNSAKSQVLYSEILDGAKVWNIDSGEGENEDKDPASPKGSGGREPMPPIDLSNLSMEGLRVVVDAEKIMEVTNANAELRNGMERKGWTYDSLRADVIAKGIESSSKYIQYATENQWPSRDTLVNMPDFPKKPDGSPDWDAFLGRERRAEWTYDSLRADVIAKGVRSSREYKKECPKNQWPAFVTLLKMPDFPKKPDGSPDWDAFLGRERRVEWTYDSLRADVIAKGIESSSKYIQYATENQWPSRDTLVNMPDFPKKPDGSPDWGAFFGRK